MARRIAIRAAARLAVVTLAVALVGVAGCWPARSRLEGTLLIGLQLLQRERADSIELTLASPGWNNDDTLNFAAADLQTVDGLPTITVPHPVSTSLHAMKVRVFEGQILIQHGQICNPSNNVPTLIERDRSNVYTIVLVDANEYEQRVEICDLLDNNCNGKVDESCVVCDADGCWTP